MPVFSAKMHQIQIRPGWRIIPCWGSLQHSQTPPPQLVWRGLAACTLPKICKWTALFEISCMALFERYIGTGSQDLMWVYSAVLSGNAPDVKFESGPKLNFNYRLVFYDMSSSMVYIPLTTLIYVQNSLLEVLQVQSVCEVFQGPRSSVFACKTGS